MKAVGILALFLASTAGFSAELVISVDKTEVAMGHTVALAAELRPASGESPEGWLLLPFLSGYRWGSHEWSGKDGRAAFVLPLPNAGPQRIEVVAWPPSAESQARAPFDRWQGVVERDLLITGARMPQAGEAVRSNSVDIHVVWRDLVRKDNQGSLIGVQWEPWFTPRNAYWQTAQAVPIIGFYSSYDEREIRQHILWFVDLGVDFILPDWSNHLWEKQHWDERPDPTAEIIHATELTLEVMARMRDEGIPVPTMVLMPGLTNGPPTTMEAINEMLAWLHHHYLRNPRFEGLWQDFDGKPLIVILDTAALAVREGTPPVDENFWTVRWMSTQLQFNDHAQKGYWTWMDGVLYPVITYRNEQPEAITVTPAYFGRGGWKYPEARGRVGGTTYIESFKPAFEKRPRVIFLHQWNEYAGQPEGQGHGEKHDVYVDSYSVELSDDLEPVSLTSPGYRSDPGGWGFYYHNLTGALLDLYRGNHPKDTVLAVGLLLQPEDADSIHITWSWMGKTPEAFEVLLDGNPLPHPETPGTLQLPKAGLASGEHTITVRAVGGTTHYPLSMEHMDTPLATPQPAEAHLTFRVS